MIYILGMMKRVLPMVGRIAKVYDGIIIICSLGIYDPNTYTWSLEFILMSQFKIYEWTCQWLLRQEGGI